MQVGITVFFYLHYTVQESNLNRACPQMAIQIIGQVLVETHVFFWPNDKGNFYVGSHWPNDKGNFYIGSHWPNDKGHFHVGSHWPNDKGHFYVGSLIQATQKQNLLGFFSRKQFSRQLKQFIKGDSQMYFYFRCKMSWVYNVMYNQKIYHDCIISTL